MPSVANDFFYKYYPLQYLVSKRYQKLTCGIESRCYGPRSIDDDFLVSERF